MADQFARSKIYTLNHPILGKLSGIITSDCDDVVQFRAIPYATLPGRFMHSVIRDNLDGRDFTKLGFACPQTLFADDIHSGGPYPGAEPIKISEYESLILQINVPLSHLESLNNASQTPVGSLSLPVLTYIHGGGFTIGKIDAHHNTAYMAQHSIAISQPLITTNIQYRVGALGFMSSPDGGKNFGLYDQRNALLWIRRFIEGFGGDNKQMTVFGESAGGFSICLHMLGHQPQEGPLFNRAIIMSGILGPLAAPQPEDEAEKVLEKILNGLEIQERGDAALEKLRALDVQKLVDASDAWIGKGNTWSPIEDSSWFKDKVTWDNVPELLGKCEWVDELVIGNTGFEGAVFPVVANGMTLTPQIFHDHLAKQMSPEAAKKTMDTYNMTLDMDQNKFLTPLTRWCGDVCFDTPIEAACRYLSTQTSKRVYRYIFDVRNPFPNAPYYQQPHHWVDVYFVFRTLQFRYPFEYLKDISDKHARFWVEFARGKAPWTTYEFRNGVEDAVVMVADDRDGWVERTQKEHERVSVTRFERLAKLWEIWAEKKGKKFLPMDIASLKDGK